MHPASEANDLDTGVSTVAAPAGIVPEPPPMGSDVEDIRGNVAVLPTRLATDLAKWLDWQSRMIHGVHASAVFLEPSGARGPLRLVAKWSSTEVDLGTLASVAARSLRNEESVVRKALGEGKIVRDHLAHPVLVRGRVVASVVLAMSVRSDEQRHAVTQLQKWCTVWLENLLEPLTSGHHDAGSLQHEALVAVSRDMPLPVSLHGLCTLLAERLHCTSVAVGLCRGLQVRIGALSHQIGFDRRTARLRELENAMEECVDRGETIVLPAVAGRELRTGIHAQLLSRHGVGAVCSVPLRVEDRVIGVLSCMRGGDEPFHEGTREEIVALADCLAPSVGSVPGSGVSPIRPRR